MNFRSGFVGIPDWPTLKALALSLNLPEASLAHPWGNEALKAHGRMWCWWSPYVDAAVFRADKAEREMLMQADPDTFTLHPHYAAHDLVLVRAGRIDPDWARARLTRQWRDAAPKKWLKAWDAEQGGRLMPTARGATLLHHAPPSPLVGEGWGGGARHRPPAPHPHPLPTRGRGGALARPPA